MTKNDAVSLFTLSGIKVLNIKALPDGYGYQPTDPRYFNTFQEKAWWFVKTSEGWIEIGWRKRVISIDWSDTPIRHIITGDDTTKDETMVHAWGTGKALEYLTNLAHLMTPQNV